MTQVHYGELISYIENYRLFFKDSAFSSEKEYRFVLRLPENKGFKISYDMKQSIMTPFYYLPFDKSGIIKRITISPMIETQLAKSGLERFLIDNGYGSKIDIDNSRIPIRY